MKRPYLTSAGRPARQVDGMDVRAVRDAAEHAIDWCRSGKGEDAALRLDGSGDEARLAGERQAGALAADQQGHDEVAVLGEEGSDPVKDAAEDARDRGCERRRPDRVPHRLSSPRPP